MVKIQFSLPPGLMEANAILNSLVLQKRLSEVGKVSLIFLYSLTEKEGY